jgi:hypothetical protein
MATSLGLFLAFSVAAMSRTEAETILSCDFDSKEVDQLVGFGGASARAPASRGDVAATVRAEPFPTPCLEMTDDWGIGDRAVSFDLLNGVAYPGFGVGGGEIECRFSLYFDNLDEYSVYVCGESPDEKFLTLAFTSDGSIRARDLNDTEDVLIGSYDTEAILPFRIKFHAQYAGSGMLRAWSMDLFIADEAVIGTRSLGANRVPGIEAIYFALGDDTDSEGTFYLDDLMVTSLVRTPVARATWGGVKARR